MNEVYRISWKAAAGVLTSMDEFSSAEAAERKVNDMLVANTPYWIFKQVKTGTTKKKDTRILREWLRHIKFNVRWKDDNPSTLIAVNDHNGVRLFDLVTHNHWNATVYDGAYTIQRVIDDISKRGHTVEVIEG